MQLDIHSVPTEGRAIDPDTERSMSSQSNSRIARGLEQFTAFCSALPVGLGTMVLAGWALHLETLKSIPRGQVVIKANTAVCLILLGLALWWLRTEHRPAAAGLRTTARLLAVIAGVAGLLSVVEFLFGLDFGIDQLLFSAGLDDMHGSVRPGLMSPLTGVSFFALGAVLVLLDSKNRNFRWVVQFLPPMVMLSAMFGVLDFVLDRGTTHTRIAPMTALVLLLYAAGMACARTRSGMGGLLVSSGAAGTLARRMLPASVIVPMLIGWLRWTDADSRLYSNWTGVAITTVTAVALLGGLTIWTALVVERSEQERRKAEAALRESEQRLAGIIGSAMDAIITVDEDQRVVLFNPAAEETLGRAAAEVLGQPLSQFIPLCFRSAHVEHIRSFGRTGQTHRQLGKQGEVCGLRAGGTEFPAECSISQIEVAGRRLFTAIVRDISERKRAEEALAHKVNELARSNRDLEQFAYVASHDLQEPLRMVAAYTQLLAERYRGRLDEDADKYIGYAVEGAQRMQALIQDLLAFSRIGRNGKDHPSTSCNASVETALQNLRAAIQESGAEVTHGELPVVSADRAQLVQLFQNLIGNAIKFRGKETPRISVSAEKVGADWVFAVSDNGLGIAAEHAEVIFMIFQRLHTRAEYPGNGVGLAICKKIVEQHGGRIWVESQAGRGSTFKFTFPALGADEETASPEQEELTNAEVTA